MADDRIIEPRRYLVTRVVESMEEGVIWQARVLGPEEIDKPTTDDPADSQRVDAYTHEEAIVLARRERLEQRGLNERDAMFTATELGAAVKAVALAERGNEEIMYHIHRDPVLSKASENAIRKIVVAAYVEMLVGN